MMKSFLDFLDDEESTDDEEEKAPVKPQGLKPSQITSASIDEACIKELRDLRKHSRFNEADKIQQNRPLIKVLFDGAQQKLRGVRDPYSVKAFIEERMEVCLPFPCQQTRPLLGDDAWDFIQKHSDNLLRILYHTHNEFIYPADSMLKHLGAVFDVLRAKITLRLREDYARRLRTQIGWDEQDMQAFRKDNENEQPHEMIMRMNLKESCLQRGMEEADIDNIINQLPALALTCTLHNKQKAAEQRAVVNPSRENSPERDPEFDPEKVKQEVEEEEEDQIDLTFLLPVSLRVPDENAKTMKSLIRKDTWYRSDKGKIRNVPFFGRCTYTEYRKMKKSVSFVSDTPTRCFIYYRGIRRIQIGGGEFTFAAHDHAMESFEVDYETYKKAKRFPMIHGIPCNRPIKAVNRGASTYSYKTRKLQGLQAKDPKEFREWQYRNPVDFVAEPMRDYAFKGGDGTGQTLPGHDGVLERNLGNASDDKCKNIQYYYYERMTCFSTKLGFAGYGSLGKSLYGFRSHRNYLHGVLMITDSILEEVNPNILLNTLLCSFVPPMNENNALNLLVDCREGLDGVRDLVISWGFEQMASFQGNRYTEAFQSLVALALKVRYICKYRCDIANEKFSYFDTIKMPKLWIMTIPEEGDLAPFLVEYNNNIRNWCQADPEFNLLDWAQLVSDAPQSYFLKFKRESSDTERKLALLFRLCREKFGLLYRRLQSERDSEYANLGSIGTGPWLKNIYEVFDAPIKTRR